MTFLFKAKVKHNGNHLFSGDWVQGSLIKKTKGYFIYVIEEDDLGNVVREFEVEVIPETVCKFTGLLDKNGNKIFELDLCKDQFNRIMKVVFHNFRLKFECISGGDSDHWKYADFIDWCKYQGAYITNNCRVETIGNIHD